MSDKRQLFIQGTALKQHASEVHDLDVWQQQTSERQRFTSESPDPSSCS